MRADAAPHLQAPEPFLQFSNQGFQLRAWFSGVKGHPAKNKDVTH